MILSGMPHIAVLKVENKTANLIDCVKFTYDLGEVSIKLKKIKPNSNKQTGVSTLYNVRDLKMIVYGADKEYLMKSELPKGYSNTITISITNINYDNCEFEIQEV